MVWCFTLHFILGNVVWLDEMTATRALINMSSMPAQDKIRSRDANEDKSSEKSKKGSWTVKMEHWLESTILYTNLVWAFGFLSRDSISLSDVSSELWCFGSLVNNSRKYWSFKIIWNGVMLKFILSLTFHFRQAGRQFRWWRGWRRRSWRWELQWCRGL